MAKSKGKTEVLITKFAKEVVKIEIAALVSMYKKTFDKNFITLINDILSLNGKVVLSGIGKSGIIAQKISSTLISIGIKSIFLHPVEALHGDAGILDGSDIVIVLSNSGESLEVIRFVEFLLKRNIKTYIVTNNPKSKLSKLSRLLIYLHTPKEACPHNIVPTSSTTAMLVFGDAVAITIMKMRKKSRDEFLKLHPGGGIGKLFSLKVSDIMRRGKQNPVVRQDATVRQAIDKMTETKLGAVSIVDNNGVLVGFFTDGDIRRKFETINLSDNISKYMTRNPVSVKTTDFAIHVAKIIEEKKVDNLPVVDDNGKVVGIIDERDLIREGIL